MGLNYSLGDKQSNGLYQLLIDSKDTYKGRRLGYVGSLDNILDNALVLDKAKVYGTARVYGNAKVYDDAEVYNVAQVYGYAEVFGNAKVYGFAKVFGNAEVDGNAQVYGAASVHEDAVIYGNAKVYRNADVYGTVEVYDNAIITGNAIVYGNTRICGNAKVDYQVNTGLIKDSKTKDSTYGTLTDFTKSQASNFAKRCNLKLTQWSKHPRGPESFIVVEGKRDDIERFIDEYIIGLGGIVHHNIDQERSRIKDAGYNTVNENWERLLSQYNYDYFKVADYLAKKYRTLSEIDLYDLAMVATGYPNKADKLTEELTELLEKKGVKITDSNVKDERVVSLYAKTEFLNNIESYLRKAERQIKQELNGRFKVFFTPRNIDFIHVSPSSGNTLLTTKENLQKIKKIVDEQLSKTVLKVEYCDIKADNSDWTGGLVYKTNCYNKMLAIHGTEKDSVKDEPGDKKLSKDDLQNLFKIYMTSNAIDKKLEELKNKHYVSYDVDDLEEVVKKDYGPYYYEPMQSIQRQLGKHGIIQDSNKSIKDSYIILQDVEKADMDDEFYDDIDAYRVKIRKYNPSSKELYLEGNKQSLLDLINDWNLYGHRVSIDQADIFDSKVNTIDEISYTYKNEVKDKAKMKWNNNNVYPRKFGPKAYVQVIDKNDKVLFSGYYKNCPQKYIDDDNLTIEIMMSQQDSVKDYSYNEGFEDKDGNYPYDAAKNLVGTSSFIDYVNGSIIRLSHYNRNAKELAKQFAEELKKIHPDKTYIVRGDTLKVIDSVKDSALTLYADEGGNFWEAFPEVPEDKQTIAEALRYAGRLARKYDDLTFTKGYNNCIIFKGHRTDLLNLYHDYYDHLFGPEEIKGYDSVREPGYSLEQDILEALYANGFSSAVKNMKITVDEIDKENAEVGCVSPDYLKQVARTLKNFFKIDVREEDLMIDVKAR